MARRSRPAASPPVPFSHTATRAPGTRSISPLSECRQSIVRSVTRYETITTRSFIEIALAGHRDGGSRVAAGRIGVMEPEPGQVVGAIAPPPPHVGGVGMGRRQVGQQVEGLPPGGLRLGRPTLLLQGPSQAPAPVRQAHL